jgi:hypothetical protein
MKVKVFNLLPGDLVKRSQWIEREGNVTELRMVLSNVKLDSTHQIEWLRIKKGITCSGFYNHSDVMEVESRLER